VNKSQLNFLKEDHVIIVTLKALEAARRALSDWARTSSPLDFTEPQLSETHDRLRAQGIMEYITEVQTTLINAEERLSETIPLAHDKVWRVPSASRHIDGVEVEEIGPLEMIRYDDYVRVLQDILHWERWTAGHVWVTNQEYLELCGLKRLYGQRPLGLGGGPEDNAHGK